MRQSGHTMGESCNTVTALCRCRQWTPSNSTTGKSKFEAPSIGMFFLQRNIQTAYSAKLCSVLLVCFCHRVFFRQSIVLGMKLLTRTCVANSVNPLYLTYLSDPQIPIVAAATITKATHAVCAWYFCFQVRPCHKIGAGHTVPKNCIFRNKRYKHRVSTYVRATPREAGPSSVPTTRDCVTFR